MSTLPQDIQDWVDKAEAFHGRRICTVEALVRLGERASMQEVWDASTHGPYLAFICGVEQLDTPAVKAVHKEHLPKVRKAERAAKRREYSGPERLQDQDAEYAEALANHAAAIKALVPNPFAP